MSDTSTNNAVITATTSGTATTLGSFVGWVNEYAVVIGFLLTIISILFGFYSHRQTMKWRESQDAAKIDALVAEKLAEIRSQSENDSSNA